MSTPTREQSERLGEQRGRFADAGARLQPASTAPRRRMLLIVNPHAATVSDGMRNLVTHALQGRFDVEAVDTKARGHATELGRQAVRDGYDLVVAFGGDGTVNEAANGLRGSDTPLCALPGGSANVFAKMLGVPGELVDATEHLLAMADDWRVRRVDLGVVNGRCFTFNSGVGLDASVVERVDARPDLKARFGPYFFTWQALTALVRRYLVRPPRMRVDDGRRTFDAITTIVQNGSPFTYFHNRPVEIVDGTSLDSGRLDAALLHRATPLGMTLLGVRALSPRARVLGHRNMTGLRELSGLAVRSADGRPLPLQVDGDFLGHVDEARYSILPGALSVVS
jgi:diacylglycerol kinase family enzyme